MEKIEEHTFTLPTGTINSLNNIFHKKKIIHFLDFKIKRLNAMKIKHIKKNSRHFFHSVLHLPLILFEH